MWCKTGQYLDYKNCICKNKLVGRITEVCTSIINETMINNDKKNIDNNTTIIFVSLFSVIMFIGITLSGLKIENYFKNILIIKIMEGLV